jgi:hypothetical protein
MKHIVSSKQLKIQKHSLIYFQWFMVLLGTSLLIVALGKIRIHFLALGVFLFPYSVYGDEG